MRASDILLLMEDEHLDVWKSKYDNKIYVDYQQGEVKEGPVLIGVFGSGSTLEEACESYLEKIRGKPLVFHACTSQRYEARIVDTGVSTSTLMQNQPQSQRWISVDDRLPKDDEHVLLILHNLHGDNYTMCGYRTYSHTQPIEYGAHEWIILTPVSPDGKISVPEKCPCIPHYCVTHWMPLPEPPKAEKEV